ncbi:MAG: leucyl aminopeptidase family protein [Myxococcota bacterium]|nr:leucyl aminopeptidase family protein [Myxococcota bacterium]
MTTVSYSDFSSAGANTLLLIGRKARLSDQTTLCESIGLSAETWTAMLESVSPGDAGASTTTWVGGRKVVVGVTPEHCSRHNSPARAWAIPGLVRAAAGGDLDIMLMLDDASHARAAASAAARALPLFTRSTSAKPAAVRIAAYADSAFVANETVQPVIDGVRLAARLFDTPTDTLNTDAFVAEAQAVADRVGAVLSVISGPALRDQGFGGLWGVGKAAVHGPALVTIKKSVKGATRSVAWVGKGIVYDTGGLSIKAKGMAGMKGDMGGAAAVLGAFAAACEIGVDHDLTAILCLAENAVGPESTRPDDVLTMRSGKTVEVNNTDAEGRLVLADGVAWACELGADLIVDCATLTGAALVATGKVHAALYCNNEALEQKAVVAGRAAGEPCHPLIYAPELFRKEFRSAIADMKNSVKDRANAQTSCAGQFIGNHLPENPPRWLHVDLAGPAWGHDDRGTGYGVGLLVGLGAG